MPEEEPKYTLLEAQKILARRECLTFGHETVERSGDNRVYEIYCERCGNKWFDIDVVTAEQAKAWEQGYAVAHYVHTGEGKPASYDNPYEKKS